MANEHNGNLIAALYAANDEDAALRVLEEMDEILDPSFIGALFAAFKRFKNSTISHYFLSSLQLYSSPQVKSGLIEIALDGATKKTDKIWVLSFLADNSYLDRRLVEVAISYWAEKLKSGEIYTYQLTSVINYLKFAKETDLLAGLLFDTLYSEKLAKDVRKLALDTLLRLDPNKYLQYFLEHYKDIQRSKCEHIFAEVLVLWNGEIVTKIEELILQDGNERAKEIIRKRRDSDKKKIEEKEVKNAQLVVTQFPNSDLVTEIYDVRKSVNIASLSNQKIKAELLSECDILVGQTRGSSNETELMKSLVDLRALIQAFNPETKNHGYTYDVARTKIPNTTEEAMKSPLNQFYLFLVSRGITVPEDLFGLRAVAVVVNKPAHPTDREGLVKGLSTLGMTELYKKQEWNKMHRLFLEKYLSALREIHKALS